MKPLISVVMPVWNGVKAGPDFFRKAVFSIVHQDYEGPVEIIVVDDGSTDNSLKSIRERAEVSLQLTYSVGVYSPSKRAALYII